MRHNTYFFAIMKKLIFSLLTLLAATTSWAETALIVHQKSGGTVEYSFNEKPVVTYADDYLVISVPGASVHYPLADMQKFTFGEVSDMVTRITAPENATPQPTFIYGIDGKLMRTMQPTEDGKTPASLDGLSTGTYIIKNGQTSYKVLKK